MCPMCERHVNEAVMKTCTPVNVASSHEAGTTVITSAEPIDEAAVMNAINAAGYKAVSAVRE